MATKRFVTCKNCGGEFVGHSKTAMYCVDCRPIMQRKRLEWHKANQKNIKKPQSEVQPMDSFLRELERYNRKHGTHLSYGKYEGLRFLGKVK